jgi:hypothetical protein
LDQQEEALDWLSRDQELKLLRQVGYLLQKLAREKIVGNKVPLDYADEYQELQESACKIVIQGLPLFALALLLHPFHELVAIQFIFELLVATSPIPLALTLPVLVLLPIYVLLVGTNIFV